MGNPIVRFEIGCKDRNATQSFYEKCFGWEIEPGEITGEISGADLSGAVTALGHEPHQYVMVYMQVGDIEDAAKSVAENGGKVKIGPVDIPGGKGRFAWFDDPEGNTLGLFQAP